MEKMKKLILRGDKNSPAKGQGIIFDVWKGRLRMRKICGNTIVDWAAFTIGEVKKILVFLQARRMVKSKMC